MISHTLTQKTSHEQLAAIYGAMAHPVRLEILDILAHGEACVCHLTAALEQRQPYVSQQLSVLRKAGLVVARRDGSMVFYRISDPHVLAILSIGKELVSPASAAEERMHASRAREIPGCPCPSCQKRKGRSK